MKSQDEIEAIRKQAEPDLLKLPGVTGVDTGPKIVNGQPTKQTAIRVYVENKSDVPPEQTIPKEIQGVPTDVIERRFVLH
jgi:hypothetical protein